MVNTLKLKEKPFEKNYQRGRYDTKYIGYILKRHMKVKKKLTPTCLVLPVDSRLVKLDFFVVNRGSDNELDFLVVTLHLFSSITC